MENPEIPEEIIKKVRKRSSKGKKDKFQVKLKILLDWVGRDSKKGKIAGCGWKNDSTFYINKEVLCSVMNIKVNSLNYNLKELGFNQSEARKGPLTFYSHKEFNESSNIESITDFKHVKKMDYSLLGQLNFKGVLATLLNDITLYGMSEKNIKIFKKSTINSWCKLLNYRNLFAISLKDFTKAFEEKVGFCTNNYEFQEALATKIPNIIDINDFAVFLARFGPFDNVIFKLGKLQQIIPALCLESNQTGTISSFFSKTYDNCFCFRKFGGEIHLYNLPNISSNSNYLTNEDGEKFQSWQLSLASSNLFQVMEFF